MSMDYERLVETLKGMLPEKIPYGELVGAPWPYTSQGEMVYPDLEDYIIEQAATAIIDLLARAEAAEAEIEQLRNEHMKIQYNSEELTVQELCARLKRAEDENDELVWDYNRLACELHNLKEKRRSEHEATDR